MYKILSNAVIYGVSGSFVALVPLVLLPFMTRTLSQADYGIAVFFSAMLTMVLPIIGFGAINAISVRYFQLKKTHFNTYLWSGFTVLLVSVVIILTLGFILFSYALDVSIIPLSWVLLGLMTASFWAVSQACGTLLIAKKMPNKYLSINLTIGSITILFTMVSISFFDFTWKGFALGLFFGHFVAALLSIYILLLSNPLAKPATEYCIDSLKFGAPIMLHSIAMSLISYFDRLIISNSLGVEELARYAVAFQLAIILSFVAQAFNKAFVPWLYENLRNGSEDAQIKIVRGTYLVFFGIVVSTVIFCFILKFLILFIAGAQYLDTYPLAIIIAIGGAFNAAYLMVVNYIFYAGKTVTLSLVSVTVASIFICTSLYLVPRYGLQGAATAFLISNALLFISIWYVAAKSYSMPWFSRKVFLRINRVVS